MIVKCFGCTTIHKKRYINASFIHSFIEYLYSKITYFTEGQQFMIFFFFCIGLIKYSNLLR